MYRLELSDETLKAGLKNKLLGNKDSIRLDDYGNCFIDESAFDTSVILVDTTTNNRSLYTVREIYALDFSSHMLPDSIFIINCKMYSHSVYIINLTSDYFWNDNRNCLEVKSLYNIHILSNLQKFGFDKYHIYRSNLYYGSKLIEDVDLFGCDFCGSDVELHNLSLDGRYIALTYDMDNILVVIKEGVLVHKVQLDVLDHNAVNTEWKIFLKSEGVM